MTTPGKLTVGADGRVTGPAVLQYNDPWPCANGTPGGSGQMMGAVMHTEVGENPGTVGWFNDPASQASAFFCVAQDGSVVQMGPVGQDWMAWTQSAGNPQWYGIEHADDGKPANPLTAEQVTASAQLVECLSAFAGFELQVSDSVDVQGYGWHGMGGVPWGDHPDCPGDVRKAQRAAIVALAKEIRDPSPEPPPAPWEVQALNAVEKLELQANDLVLAATSLRGLIKAHQ
jgi:N-acetylmuramoyl-L-alanine amidase